jgi:nitrite reductase (NADH) small subunit
MNSSKRWVRITDCRNIPVREGRSVKIGRREVAIFNLGERFLAIENRCPHRGGPLADGIVSGATVVCPLHAGKVNLETGVTAGAAAAAGCVKRFDIRVQENCILLAIPVDIRKEEVMLEPDCEKKCPSAWTPRRLMDTNDSIAGSAEA